MPFSWGLKFVVLFFQRGRLVLIALGESDLLVELHLGQSCLHVLLCVSKHDVAGVVVHAQVVDEQPGPDEVVEVGHHGAGQEQHLLPLLHVDHLTLDVERLVDFLVKEILHVIKSAGGTGGTALVEFTERWR